MTAASPRQVVPRVAEKAGGLGLLDKWVIYPLGIHLMRDGVAGLLGRLRFIHSQSDWGPGRVDTFNSAKAIFGVPFEQLSPEELVGVSDFPAIWNQGKKQGMQLHWDGNNSRVEERNLSACVRTGATPRLIDHAAIARTEAWMPPPCRPHSTGAFPSTAHSPRAARRSTSDMRRLPRRKRQRFFRRIRRQGHADCRHRHRRGRSIPTPCNSRKTRHALLGHPDRRFRHFRKTWAI